MHRLPPAVKILMIFILAAASFYAPALLAFILWGACLLLSIVILRFPLQAAVSDNKPAFAYAIMLYIASIILNTVSFFQSGEAFSIGAVPQILAFQKSYIDFLAKLTLSLEVTSIFYRTTSKRQFKEGFSDIEYFITRNKKLPLSESLSLTMLFIPKIASLWSQITRAWISRGGKNNLKKISSLIPILLRLSMRHAWEKSKAIAARS